MPELPEVETTRRGLAPHLIGRTVTAVVVRDSRLRWPVPIALVQELPGQRIAAVRRRGKYLFLEARTGTVILHLGMSGSLRLVSLSTAPGPHEHLDLMIGEDTCLRLRDPRRFGVVLWTREPPEHHPLLAALGPEPWDVGFTGAYLYGRARGRRVAVKNFIMDSHTVAGVAVSCQKEGLLPLNQWSMQFTDRLAYPPACDSVVDPKLPHFLIPMSQREPIGGERVREVGRIKVHADVVFLGTVDPAAEVLDAQGVAVDLLAAGFGVEGVQVEPVAARDHGQGLLEVGAQLIGRPGLTEVIAGDGQPAA